MNTLIKIGFLSLLLAAVGCATGKTAGESVDDSWIHAKVKSELVGLGTKNINIEVHRGIVQLAGFVDSTYQRESAEKVAASVKGVRDVSNQLVVQTSIRSAGRTLDDGVVAGKVKTKLAENVKTSGLRINVEVRHGVVLLSGFVVSEEERKEALTVAAAVDGVIDVINGLDVVSMS